MTELQELQAHLLKLQRNGWEDTVRRRVWITSKETEITQIIIDKAISNNCPEIATGIPSALIGVIKDEDLPLAYEEPAYPISEKPRDLAAEIDALKAEVEALKVSRLEFSHG